MNKYTEIKTVRNILLVISKMGKGGGQQIVLDLACGLRRRGFSVDILLLFRSPQDGVVLSQLEPGIELVFLGKRKGAQIKSDHSSFVKRFLCLLAVPFSLLLWVLRGELDKYEVVHCNLLSASFIGFLSNFFTWALHKKRPVFVETFHGDFSGYSKFENYIFQYLWGHLDALVAEFRQSDFNTLVARYGKDRVRYIPFGVELPQEPVSNVTSEFWSVFDFDPDLPMILTIARLNIDEKHIDKLLEVIAQIKKIYGKDFVFLLCGDGPDKDELRQYSKALGVEKQTVFAGYIDYVAVPLKRASVFLIAGIEDLVGVAGLQAASFGVPVVSYQAEPNPVPVDGKYFYASPCVREVAQEISSILNDKLLHHRSAQHSLKLAQKEFSVDVMVDRYVDLYRELSFKAT